MSFTCEVCKQPQTPRTKPHNVVVVVREVAYKVSQKTKKKLGLKKPFTKGYETVKEAVICDNCFVPNFVPLVIGEKRVG